MERNNNGVDLTFNIHLSNDFLNNLNLTPTQIDAIIEILKLITNSANQQQVKPDFEHRQTTQHNPEYARDAYKQCKSMMNENVQNSNTCPMRQKDYGLPELYYDMYNDLQRLQVVVNKQNMNVIDLNLTINQVPIDIHVETNEIRVTLNEYGNLFTFTLIPNWFDLSEHIRKSIKPLLVNWHQARKVVDNLCEKYKI